jgi:cell filamentation protein
MARYEPKGVEAEFEPGSRGRVLRNLLGIKRVREMNILEAQALQSATDQFIRTFDENHRFTAADIRNMHRTWLGAIYPWAGDYRNLNVSKGDFLFAASHLIPELMSDFEKKVMTRRTPCRYSGWPKIADALAEVHAEFVLIHPFREGNGRIARLLATLMALQAGLPQLDFTPLAENRGKKYIAAIQAGLDRNYEPLTQIFEKIIERSVGASS